jgi:hypothetical protein
MYTQPFRAQARPAAPPRTSADLERLPFMRALAAIDAGDVVAARRWVALIDALAPGGPGYDGGPRRR